MTDPTILQCPVCQVKIEGSRVLFSYGPPGSLERLSARVCRYAKNPGCINQGIPESDLQPKDFYGDCK